MKGKHEPEYDVVIIGGGIAGLSAAVYAGRMRLKSLMLAADLGGTITKTNIVENYPGFKSISGLNLANKILEHAKQYDTEIIQEKAKRIKRCKEGCFIVYTANRHFHARTLIFCTGSRLRELNIKGEKRYKNKGVHYCALCDGPLYKDKILAVAGGGDSAVKEALLLAKYAKRIYIIAKSRLKPEPVNYERIKKENKIEIIENMQIKEIKGNSMVNSVILAKEYKNKKELNVNGIFVNIGHIPLSDLAVKSGVKVNKNNEIIIDKESKTNIKGVYAAGDIADAKFKQAITGVGEAVKAVYSIYEYIKGERVKCSYVNEE